jgi:hypothetical protein
LRKLINDDRARVVQFHAGAFEPKAFGMRIAPDGVQHRIRLHRLAGRERRENRVAGFLEFRKCGLQRELRAAALHFYMHVRAQVVVEATQQLVAAMQDAGLGAEAVENVCELKRDVAATDDQYPLGKLLQQERFVRSDAELDPRQSFR